MVFGIFLGMFVAVLVYVLFFHKPANLGHSWEEEQESDYVCSTSLEWNSAMSDTASGVIHLDSPPKKTERSLASTIFGVGPSQSKPKFDPRKTMAYGHVIKVKPCKPLANIDKVYIDNKEILKYLQQLAKRRLEHGHQRSDGRNHR